MATLASKLILEVSTDLIDQDPGDTYSRWTETDLLGYLNDAQSQIVFFMPTANIDAVSFQLAAGVAQSVPSSIVELVSVDRNMGADGATPGETIYPIDSKDMDEGFPGWRSATAAATVIHFMFDAKDRRSFDVYPPQPAANQGWVEATGSVVPTVLASSALNISLGDEYGPAIKAFMKYAAYSMDAAHSEYAGVRAQNWWNMFLTLIGRKDLIEKQYPARKNGNSSQSVSQ